MQDNIEKIFVPELGESIFSANITKWLITIGDFIYAGDPILEIESEKVTLEIFANSNGILIEKLKQDGDIVKVGDLAGIIEQTDKIPIKNIQEIDDSKTQYEIDNNISDQTKEINIKSDIKENIKREVKRFPMTTIRKTIAKKLKHAQNNAAILTTFNEVDMSALVSLRSQYNQMFQVEYNVKLGFMSFFIKACIEALKRIPILNSYIEEDEIVSHNYYDIGFAMSAPEGLIVPVIRDANKLKIFEIEKIIDNFIEKSMTNTIKPKDLEGATFTISNGGIFGSLMSTPILNPPSSGILGMHKIQERPVVVGGQIVIRPMMYIALSYDHRIIDGKDAVTFLHIIKDFIEMPTRFYLEI